MNKPLQHWLSILLFCSAGVGFLTAYIPDVWGMPFQVWLSDFVKTISYFTIISNLAVMLMTGCLLFASQSSLTVKLSSASAQTAIAVYVSVSAIIYHLLLGDTWNPQGVTLFSDHLLHTVTPIFYLVYWWTSVRGKPMNFKKTFYVLTIPLVYLLYWLIRGAVIGKYPYFFMDLNELGIAVVTINIIGLSFFFWLLAVVYWALNRFTTPLYV